MHIIETARLRLRPFTVDDLDALHAAVYGDAEVTRYLPGGAPWPREKVQKLIAFYVKHWEEHGFGPWAVIHRADSRFIGEAGLNTVPKTDPPEVEVLYAYARAYWGRGIATESASASLRYGFEEAGLERIIALAFPENIASQRVMQKIGMTHEGLQYYYDADLETYSISREAFQWDGSPYRLTGLGPS